MLFATIAIFLAALPMSETFKPIILKRRAIKHNLPVPDTSNGMSMRRAFALKLGRPLHMLFTEVRLSTNVPFQFFYRSLDSGVANPPRSP